MNGHIVVVGSLNMDLVVRAPRLPRLGETVLGSDFRTFPGGKGANQAVACARLGGKVKMVGRVGADSFGQALLSTMAQDGVDLTFVRQDAEAVTGVALITVEDGGDNAIVVAPGANGRVSVEDVVASEQAFDGAAVLVVQLECPLAAVQKAIQLAHQRQAQVVLNPAPAQPLPQDLLRQVDYLIPNQSEILLLSGNEELDPAIDHLAALGIKNLVVTLGEKGSMVVGDSTKTHLPAYRVVAVDTTAAGDAFVGAFAVALAEGASVLEAARWGNAAGALAVTKAGAQPSLPTRQALLDFMAANQPSS